MSAPEFLVPIHDISHRAGMGKDVELELAAPPDMGTEVIRVPEGSPLHLDVRLESASDGVYVSGRVTGELAGECVRCLEPLDAELQMDLAELYLYPSAVARAEEEGDEEAAEMLTTDGEALDLEPMVRDAIVLELPFQPLCRPDCPGLCPTCGIRMEDAEEGHSHEVIDPRFAALAGLFEQEGVGRDDAGTDGAAGDVDGADGTDGTDDADGTGNEQEPAP